LLISTSEALYSTTKKLMTTLRNIVVHYGFTSAHSPNKQQDICLYTIFLAPSSHL